MRFFTVVSAFFTVFHCFSLFFTAQAASQPARAGGISLRDRDRAVRAGPGAGGAGFDRPGERDVPRKDGGVRGAKGGSWYVLLLVYCALKVIRNVNKWPKIDLNIGLFSTTHDFKFKIHDFE